MFLEKQNEIKLKPLPKNETMVTDQPAQSKRSQALKRGVIERHAIYATTHWENQDGIQPARNIGIIVMKKEPGLLIPICFSNKGLQNRTRACQVQDKLS